MKINNIFQENWCSAFQKKNSVFVSSGKVAIKEALRLLDSNRVVIPTYTCERILEAVVESNCVPIIVDCDDNLQIDIDSINEEAKVDTVIVPHMFGIQCDVNKIKRMGYNVIEDCSQCMGLDDLGKYSDIVIASFGPTKWLPVGTDKKLGGGVISYDFGKLNTSSFWKRNISMIEKANYMYRQINDRLDKRIDLANEFINAGLKLIGSDMPNAWLRAMYVTDDQKRIPYVPLHDLYGGFDCRNIDRIKDNLDWVSIIV